jgi:hypothetical protein
MSFAERDEACDGGKGELAKLAWMALALTPGMGPTRIWRRWEGWGRRSGCLRLR